MYFCVASPPTYRSRFPGNKQTYGFGCFHLKVSLRWRRQWLSFVKTFRTTNRRVASDYVHGHALRAVRLHYIKLALSSRLRDICITHCWEHRARPPAALENELSTLSCLFRQRSKRLIFKYLYTRQIRTPCCGLTDSFVWVTLSFPDRQMTWVFCDESLHLSRTIPNVTICVGSLRPWAARLGQTLIITKQNGVFRPSTREVHDHYLQCTFEGGIFLGKEVLRHRR